MREVMQRCLIGHEGPASAACTLILSVEFERYQWRYRHERALRNLYVETGRIAHHLLLQATAHGLGTHILYALTIG